MYNKWNVCDYHMITICDTIATVMKTAKTATFLVTKQLKNFLLFYNCILLRLKNSIEISVLHKLYMAWHLLKFLACIILIGFIWLCSFYSILTNRFKISLILQHDWHQNLIKNFSIHITFPMHNYILRTPQSHSFYVAFINTAHN